MSALPRTPVFALSLLLLVGWAWFYTSQHPVIKLDRENLLNSIDSTISQLRVRQFDADGELINELTTPLMAHVPKKNVHMLQTPYIVLHKKDEAPWEIRSDKAKSFNGGERITFIKQVVIHQDSHNEAQASTLKTERMTYYPREKKASTKKFVTYEQAGNKVESTGMNAYLDEKRVELLQGAKGSYAPATTD